MPRKFTNPISEWLESRAERKRELENEAAKLISNDTARNKGYIIYLLYSIDFANSRIPKEVLEHKSDESQNCGDLEFAALRLINVLMKDSQTIKVDIREIDEKLITLAKLFGQAVEQGDTQAAYAARTALTRGIQEIRTRIPRNQPELAKQFVEKNTQYLEGWITLVFLAQGVDCLEENVDNQRKNYERDVQACEQRKKEIEKQVQNNTDFAEAFMTIVNHDTSKDRSEWTDAQQKVYRMLSEQVLNKAHVELNKRKLEADEQSLIEQKARMDTLHARLDTLSIVEPTYEDLERISVKQMTYKLYGEEEAERIYQGALECVAASKEVAQNAEN